MQGRPPLANEERRVIDLNVLAIFLVEDHPGHSYVAPVIEEGLRGAYVPLIMDVLPLRAYWVMTEKWGCGKEESARAIRHFVKEYHIPQYFSLHRQTILNSFDLAEELNHDVYDCVYLAAAKQENARAIITTDTDFERLCGLTGLEYMNPVPSRVLRQFREWGGVSP
jgi:predicted nucleic acid-binding protein